MKLRNFKCHVCGAIILTNEKKIRCENCGNEYTLKNGRYYRENWITKSYGRFKNG